MKIPHSWGIWNLNSTGVDIGWVTFPFSIIGNLEEMASDEIRTDHEKRGKAIPLKLYTPRLCRVIWDDISLLAVRRTCGFTKWNMEILTIIHHAIYYSKIKWMMVRQLENQSVIYKTRNIWRDKRRRRNWKEMYQLSRVVRLFSETISIQIGSPSIQNQKVLKNKAKAPWEYNKKKSL